MRSIDAKSFMRFGIWTMASLLVYYLYVFVGLHTSPTTRARPSLLPPRGGGRQAGSPSRPLQRRVI
jgi:hypothetical protein